MIKLNKMSSISKVFSRIFVTKILFMIANIAVYFFALKTFGGKFALAHASLLLVMNIHKSGCSYHGIEKGNGALDYANKDLIKRVLLSLVWGYFLSIYTDILFFYISIFGVAISILWLKAYDSHLLGEYKGSFVYSSIPLLSTLLCIIFFTFGYDHIIQPKSSIYISLIFGFVFIFIFFQMLSKVKNVLAEICNASISPILISFLVAQNFGSNEWLYIFAFKGYEALAQISIFLLTATRNSKISLSKLRKYSLIYYLLILAISLLISYSIGLNKLIILGSWILFLVIYSYWFIIENNKHFISFISLTLAIVYLGTSFYEIYLLGIFSSHIILSIIFLLYFFKRNRIENTI